MADHMTGSALVAPVSPPGAPGGLERTQNRSRMRTGVRWLAGQRILAAAAAVLVAMVLLAVIGPLLWSPSPDQQNLLSSLQPPSAAHPMGTDEYGRDVFARFMRGAQISLLVGFIVVITGAAIGGAIGLAAGVWGGARDSVLMRVMDAILAFPALILAMTVTIGLGVGITTSAIGIVIASIPWYARVVRSEAARISSLQFVEALVALGARRRRIMYRHIVPSLLPTLLIQGAAAYGYAILTLAALGFVGLGAQIPTPEWGAMITDGLSYTVTGQWWLGVFPGLGLLITSTAASVIADKLRDILDPKGDYVRA
jgi:peptide/nickel transport system permease protein